MERVLVTERMVFPSEGLSFEVRGLDIQRLALVSRASQVRGRIDKGLLMIRTLQAGVVDPPLDERAATILMREHPEVALHLAVRISQLTTG